MSHFFYCTDDHRRIETRLAKILISHLPINKSIRVLIAPTVNKIEHNSANQITLTKFKLNATLIIL